MSKTVKLVSGRDLLEPGFLFLIYCCMPPTYHLCSKSLPTCLRTNGTEKIEHTEYKNHHFVSLRRKFWKFIQARTFPSVFKNKEVAACSSNWAEGQAKTPKRLNKLEQVWAWSGYYPTATLLMSPITLRSNNQRKGLNSHSGRLRGWLICLLSSALRVQSCLALTKCQWDLTDPNLEGTVVQKLWSEN